MTGSTPWWGTIIVATLGLAGVLWTQFRADRREMNARNETRKQELTGPLRDTYRELFALMNQISTAGGRRQELVQVISTIQLLAPEDILSTTQPLLDAHTKLTNAVAEHGGKSDEYRAAYTQMKNSIEKTRSAVRKSLDVDN